MDREPAKRFEELVVWQKAHRRRGNQRQPVRRRTAKNAKDAKFLWYASRCPVANQPSFTLSACSAVAVFDSCRESHRPRVRCGVGTSEILRRRGGNQRQPVRRRTAKNAKDAKFLWYASRCPVANQPSFTPSACSAVAVFDSCRESQIRAF